MFSNFSALSELNIEQVKRNKVVHILNIPPKSVCVHRLTEIITSYEICFHSRHAQINGNGYI